MKKATRNIFKMHGWRIDRAIHNYIYFRFYTVYVKLFLGAGRLLRDWFGWLKPIRHFFGIVFNRYHAKVLTESDAVKMISLNKDLIIGPDKSSRIIPFEYANNIILKDPQIIAVMDCPCRKHRGEKGCKPYDVCIAVGRTTAEFWLEVGRQNHARQITQAEALKIITDARKRGCITTAWFKVATGGRTGVICSCCACCCGGIEGRRIGKSFDNKLTNMVSSGYVVKADPAACKSCGNCVKVCPFGAIKLDADGKRVYDWDACMGCGLCVEKCENRALTLVRDSGKGDPLDLDALQVGVASSAT